nr:MAG TPA: hypothetical protein [Bacteriophage sp.]DAX88304.1 MAG TPA: hypothetical protein [Caudoviricetes sp.]
MKWKLDQKGLFFHKKVQQCDFIKDLVTLHLYA